MAIPDLPAGKAKRIGDRALQFIAKGAVAQLDGPVIQAQGGKFAMLLVEGCVEREHGQIFRQMVPGDQLAGGHLVGDACGPGLVRLAEGDAELFVGPAAPDRIFTARLVREQGDRVHRGVRPLPCPGHNEVHQIRADAVALQLLQVEKDRTTSGVVRGQADTGAVVPLPCVACQEPPGRLRLAGRQGADR